MFLEGLVDVVDPAIAHFNKRCISITESETNPNRLVVHFQDGSTHETDVVLGADGIKSTVREYVVGANDKRVQFSNTVAYRGLIPYDQLKEAGFKIDVREYPACICGPSKVGHPASRVVFINPPYLQTNPQHFILFPIKDSEIVRSTLARASCSDAHRDGFPQINIVAFDAQYDIPFGAQNLPDGAPWVEVVSRDVLDQVYAGFGPDVASLIKCMPEQSSKWSIYVVDPPLETYAKGRVALLGDAVCSTICCDTTEYLDLTAPIYRHTGCSPTWAQAQGRASRTRIPLHISSVM